MPVAGAVRNRPHLLPVKVGGVYPRVLVRKRSQKHKRQPQPVHAIAKVRAIRAVPRDNLVEPAELPDQTRGRFGHPQQIDARGSYVARPAGKARQRDVACRGPDLEGIAAETLQRGQGDDEIPDAARPDRKPLHAATSIAKA